MNLKRLIVKRFGSISNLLLFVASVLLVYSLAKNYFFESSQETSKSDSTNRLKQKFEKNIKKSEGDLNEADLTYQQDEEEEDEDKVNENIRPSQDLKKSLKVKLKANSETLDPQCKIEEKCPENSYSYKLVSGEGMSSYPVICLNGRLLVGKDLKDNKIGRGLNVIVADKDSLALKVNENYDTFTDDSDFFRMLKTSTEDGDIILMASYDEMANAIRELTIKLMELFGSQLFSTVKFRDSFIMIGQRGVPKGKAIELIQRKGKENYAKAAMLTGCATFPLGVIKPVKFAEVNVINKNQLIVGSIVENCGIKEACKADEFAVHISNGKDDKDEPKICVDGKYVIARGINDAGRGLNIVLVGKGKEVLSVAHFDTYAEDSTNLEIFLEGLYEDCIIIAVTFDEASTKLGTLARNLFFDLGSALVQNLRFRDGWFFVGRNGINGFTPIEEISYAGSEAFPPLLDRKYCVPITLKGLKIRPDPLPTLNDKRRDFCSRFDGYGDFCSNENIDKKLEPAPFINKTLEEHPVYSTPIIVIGGIAMSHNSLRMTLETIIMQPGINPKVVYVCLDKKMTELASLVNLFGFHHVEIESSQSYVDIMHKSLIKLIESSDFIGQEKDNFIIIEEELILSPDFLYFFSQIFDVYTGDESIAAITSFNPNGFSNVGGNAGLVYRVNDFPGLGFMLKRKVYEEHLKGRLKQCCKERVWYDWKLKDKKKAQVLMPDVSRVFRRPYDIPSTDFSFLSNFFNRKRKTNLMPFPGYIDLSDLQSQDDYQKYLKTKLNEAVDFKNASISCSVHGSVSFPATTKDQYYKIVYDQKTENDISQLPGLCKCLNLFYDEKKPPKAMYGKGIIRFYAKHNYFILIGSLNSLLANQNK